MENKCRYENSQICMHCEYWQDCFDNINQEVFDYKIIPKIDLQKESCFKLKKSLLKGKIYEVKDGILLDENGFKINVGSNIEFNKTHKDFIEVKS